MQVKETPFNALDQGHVRLNTSSSFPVWAALEVGDLCGGAFRKLGALFTNLVVPNLNLGLNFGHRDWLWGLFCSQHHVFVSIFRAANAHITLL